MKVWQRAGLLSFLTGLGIMIMMFVENLIVGEIHGNMWIPVTFVVLGAILFLIGD